MHDATTSDEDFPVCTIAKEVERKFKPMPRIRKRSKQRYLNSNGTYSGYSGTVEGEETIAAKRIRIYKNSGPSNTNWAYKNGAC